MLAELFFRDIIKKKLAPKFSKLKKFFNKNELIYFMCFRFIGGGGTPYGIQNILPIIFNMNLNHKFPLKYNKNIEPIKSVIIFNTLIFFYCYYVTYIITNSCNYLLLFLLQWFYTSANKGFIFIRIYFY